jgi:hypothetical protein
MDTKDNRTLYAKLVAKAWTDDTFKAQLLKDPGTTVRDSGMILPANAVVLVISSSEDPSKKGFDADTSGPTPTLRLTLPDRPKDLTDEAILAYTSEAYHGCLGISSSSSYT